MSSTPPRTVLLVEDEPAIGRLVSGYMERDGHAVRWVRTAEEALAELTRGDICLALVDVGLPGMDGFELLAEIRRRGSTPVVMLTARDEEDDRLTGFSAGADDYIGKPFSPRELVARVNAVLRRAERPPSRDELTAADVVVHRAAREVLVAGRPCRLRSLEFDLLAHLLENRDRVVSREELLEAVWGLSYPGGTRTVDVHVAAVRRKLARPEVIQTVRGAGYRVADG